MKTFVRFSLLAALASAIVVPPAAAACPREMCQDAAVVVRAARTATRVVVVHVVRTVLDRAVRATPPAAVAPAPAARGR